jgi:hypothetical protein
MERLAVMRTGLGVVAGYVLFVLATIVLFMVTGREVHEDATIPFMIVATIYGMVAALVAGLIATAISGRTDPRAGAILGGVIAFGAMISMLTVPAGANMRPMIAALVLMAPMAWLGGKSMTILKRQLANYSKEPPGGRA